MLLREQSQTYGHPDNGARARVASRLRTTYLCTVHEAFHAESYPGRRPRTPGRRCRYPPVKHVVARSRVAAKRRASARGPSRHSSVALCVCVNAGLRW